MHAGGMLGKCIFVTAPTIYRFQTTSVSAFVGTDMTGEAIRLAVRGVNVCCRIDRIMALEAGIRVFSVRQVPN